MEHRKPQTRISITEDSVILRGEDDAYKGSVSYQVDSEHEAVEASFVGTVQRLLTGDIDSNTTIEVAAGQDINPIVIATVQAIFDVTLKRDGGL